MDRAFGLIALLTGLALIAAAGDWMLSRTGAQHGQPTSLTAPARVAGAQGQVSAEVAKIGPLPDMSGLHSDLSVLDQVLAAKIAMEEAFKPLSPSVCPLVSDSVAETEGTPNVAQ